MCLAPSPPLHALAAPDCEKCAKWGRILSPKRRMSRSFFARHSGPGQKRSSPSHCTRSRSACDGSTRVPSCKRAYGTRIAFYYTGDAFNMFTGVVSTLLPPRKLERRGGCREAHVPQVPLVSLGRRCLQKSKLSHFNSNTPKFPSVCSCHVESGVYTHLPCCHFPSGPYIPIIFAFFKIYHWLFSMAIFIFPGESFFSKCGN